MLQNTKFDRKVKGISIYLWVQFGLMLQCEPKTYIIEHFHLGCGTMNKC